ncbi:sensor histidine kinase [Pseudodesulfovibrio tunisiensis]|uniref:sensor histidine kinase n=1 Tax=Pseudodesulfovibrio tunisiensis TaxID=463192 RepID=UPI001FB28BF8|nr:sensor histidine kinase [Pseudodesulfovibrio tunisiensis]
MSQLPNDCDREDLRFFGRISASVSHEIKNVFAIINEGAGLIDDLTLLADKGVPVDPEKLRSVARTILDQIQRGDRIVRNMNTFAHTVDEDVRHVDLAETVTLMSALSKRLASINSVTLATGECASVEVVTSPYFLNHLLHGIISHAVGCAGQGTTLTLAAGTDDKGALLSLAGPASLETTALPEEISRIAATIQADVTPGKTPGTICVHLPATIN